MTEKGFLLIELLIALALAGLVVAACLDIVVTSARGTQKAENIGAALDLCRERFEQIKSLSLLREGQGSNAANPPLSPFLPALTTVSISSYDGVYLTESDYYNSVDSSVPGSLSALHPPVQVDRITQIAGVDDAPLGDGPDYYRVTVSVFWEKGSYSMTSIITAR
ncbi:MAG: prepilin-type N-terminal cleavage/methylation domain-containing protein [Planctomycetota bacterium]